MWRDTATCIGKAHTGQRTVVYQSVCKALLGGYMVLASLHVAHSADTKNMTAHATTPSGRACLHIFCFDCLAKKKMLLFFIGVFFRVRHAPLARAQERTLSLLGGLLVVRLLCLLFAPATVCACAPPKPTTHTRPRLAHSTQSP